MTQIEQQEISKKKNKNRYLKNLFCVAGKINSNVSISQEQLIRMLKIKTELAEFLPNFRKFQIS